MRKIAKIKGLCCANCAAKLEKSLSKIKGVNSVQLNFMAQRVTFDIEDSMIDEVIADIKKLTKKLEPEVEYKGI